MGVWTALVLCLWVDGRASACRAIGYFENRALCDAVAGLAAPPPSEEAVLRCVGGGPED
jgi:hypothetical protein